MGIGKPLKSTVHPLRNEIPIYLGAEGPKNVSLAAEICDGWLPLFFSPKDDDWYRDRVRIGFEAAGALRLPVFFVRAISPSRDDSAWLRAGPLSLELQTGGGAFRPVGGAYPVLR